MRVLWAVSFSVLSALLVFGFLAPGIAPVAVTSPVSDSMEPTAPEHSLVVVVEETVTVGDVILYESPQRNTPVLHRAVGVTEANGDYITQGDANERPDQAVGAAPVSPSQIDGVVPTVAGNPVIVPYLGGILTNPIVLLGSWGLLALSLLYSTRIGKIARGGVTTVPIRKYGIAVAVLLVIGLPVATGLFVVPVQTNIVTSTTASPASSAAVEPGEMSERTVSATSPFYAVLHTAVVVEGDLSLQDTTSSIGEQTTEITVQNAPSAEPRIHEGTVLIYSYPSVLPGVVAEPVEAIHPILASFLSAFTIGVAMVGVSYAFDRQQIVRATGSEFRTHRDNRNRRHKR